ncbi:MAG: response regulator transcription factor [Betaproteobacteria bacterium]
MMNMPLRADTQQRSRTSRAIDFAALPLAASIEGDRAFSAEGVGFEVIHFFSDSPTSALVQALREYGCQVIAHQADADISALADATRATVVMDVPHLSKSFNFCRQLRARGIDFPLVMLAGTTDPFDEVLALELGADEVIGRQVHPRVLLARLHAISRRALRVRPEGPVATLRFGDLHVDGANRDVTLCGKRVGTTSGEFDLLWLLVQNAGHVIQRDDVLRRLRGLTGSHGNRSIDARLYRLRQRFAHVQDVAARIKSVRPYGYMFVNAPW